MISGEGEPLRLIGFKDGKHEQVMSILLDIEFDVLEDVMFLLDGDNLGEFPFDVFVLIEEEDIFGLTMNFITIGLRCRQKPVGLDGFRVEGGRLFGVGGKWEATSLEKPIVLGIHVLVLLIKLLL